jgi:hypothetical protein
VRQEGLEFGNEEAGVLVVKDRQEIRMITINCKKGEY